MAQPASELKKRKVAGAPAGSADAPLKKAKSGRPPGSGSRHKASTDKMIKQGNIPKLQSLFAKAQSLPSSESSTSGSGVGSMAIDPQTTVAAAQSATAKPAPAKPVASGHPHSDSAAKTADAKSTDKPKNAGTANTDGKTAGRKFNLQWKTGREWLVFEKGVMTCSSCTKAKGKGPWAHSGCVTIEIRSVKMHETSEEHKLASVETVTVDVAPKITPAMLAADKEMTAALTALFDVAFTTVKSEVCVEFIHFVCAHTVTGSFIQLANRKVNVVRELLCRWSSIFSPLAKENAKYTSNEFLEVFRSHSTFD